MFEYKNQKIEYLREPQAIIIKNFFGKELVKRFIRHMDVLKNSFTDAGIHTGDKNTVAKTVRSNKVMYLGNVFPEMNKSVLGKNLIEAIQSNALHQIVNSSFSPVFDLSMTNYSEIQLSRYGGTEEKYDWHIDMIANNMQRWLTLVYYFFKEPKRWKGGELSLTNGLIHGSKLVNQTPKPKITKIKPECDMTVLFSSRTPHQVSPTSSPKRFTDGRFSVNMWIGFAVR